MATNRCSHRRNSNSTTPRQPGRTVTSTWASAAATAALSVGVGASDALASRRRAMCLASHRRMTRCAWKCCGRPRTATTSGRAKSGQVKSSQVKPGQVKSSQVKSGRVRSSQVKSDRVSSQSGRVRSGTCIASWSSSLSPSFVSCKARRTAADCSKMMMTAPRHPQTRRGKRVSAAEEWSPVGAAEEWSPVGAAEEWSPVVRARLRGTVARSRGACALLLVSAA
jgi:hypothetical protein